MISTNIDDTIQPLVKSFFKRSLPDFKDEHIKDLTWEAQELFLKQTVHSSLYKNYPSSQKFCRLFFKKLIEHLEQDQEVHDDVYNFLCSKMDNEDTTYSYHHYLIDDSISNIITIKETKNMVFNGTTGLRTWEAAFILSDWALCNKDLFLNKSILEIGSGVGFTGVTVAKYCHVNNMIMSDFHEEVLETICNNIQINFPASRAERINELTIWKSEDKKIGVMKLDWSNIKNVPGDLKPDIVIGADIVYDPSILPHLLQVFEFFHDRNKDIEIYVASVIRNEDTFNGFLKAIEISSFKYKEIALVKHEHVEWDKTLVRCLLRINKE